jgi:hypothetical protein
MITATLRTVTATRADDGTIASLVERIDLGDEVGPLDPRTVSIDDAAMHDAALAQFAALAPALEAQETRGTVSAFLRSITATFDPDGTLYLEGTLERTDATLGRLSPRVVSFDDHALRDAARAQIVALAPVTESQYGIPLTVPQPVS